MPEYNEEKLDDFADYFIKLARDESENGSLDAMDWLLYYADRYLTREGSYTIFQKVKRDLRINKIAGTLYVSRGWILADLGKEATCDDTEDIIPPKAFRHFKKKLKENVERILKEWR